MIYYKGKPDPHGQKQYTVVCVCVQSIVQRVRKRTLAMRTPVGHALCGVTNRQ